MKTNSLEEFRNEMVTGTLIATLSTAPNNAIPKALRKVTHVTFSPVLLLEKLRTSKA